MGIYIYIYICVCIYVLILRSSPILIIGVAFEIILLFANGPEWIPKWEPNGSQKDAKRVPNGSQMGPKGGHQRAQDTKNDIAGFLVIPDRCASRFASGIQRGSQNAAVGDQSSIRGFKNGVPEGGRDKVRKMRRNRVPKLVFWGGYYLENRAPV